MTLTGELTDKTTSETSAVTVVTRHGLWILCGLYLGGVIEPHPKNHKRLMVFKLSGREKFIQKNAVSSLASDGFVANGNDNRIWLTNKGFFKAKERIADAGFPTGT